MGGINKKADSDSYIADIKLQQALDEKLHEQELDREARLLFQGRYIDYFHEEW